MLSIRSVRHFYGDRQALAAPDLDLARDARCALIGPSGCGKTTLLHILAGLLPPSEGRVVLEGDDLYQPRRADRWRGARIGVVPQKLHLVASLSALGNVRLAQHFVGADASDGAARELLLALGLGDVLHARPSQMSMGQQQRVAIARAIVNRPRLLLADEPTSALDDGHARRALGALFDAARRAGAALVVATHDARIRGDFATVVELQAG